MGPTCNCHVVLSLRPSAVEAFHFQHLSIYMPRVFRGLELEDVQRVAQREGEREEGHKDVTDDMSEDLSDGEKGDIIEPVKPDSPGKHLDRNFSTLEVWSESNREKKLYIVLIRVDLFTRQVLSSEVDWSYSEPTEMLSTGPEEANLGESSGAYMVRIPFGTRDKYLRLLWPHILEFVDGALAHILNMSKALGDQIGGGQPVWPYVIYNDRLTSGFPSRRIHLLEEGVVAIFIPSLQPYF
ncbi:probable sucrose-phosphate synthase 2 [Salvia splendens]|uniref:probable sucrose-phosphate synthase 2 n=1 Tax=Salvia splendens TaxID=180675 RepID=UPI001C260201|nr:probable sucrose-phosphate synthase 2 [Salvia splendens]